MSSSSAAPASLEVNDGGVNRTSNATVVSDKEIKLKEELAALRAENLALRQARLYKDLYEQLIDQGQPPCWAEAKARKILAEVQEVAKASNLQVKNSDAGDCNDKEDGSDSKDNEDAGDSDAGDSNAGDADDKNDASDSDNKEDADSGLLTKDKLKKLVGEVRTNTTQKGHLMKPAQRKKKLTALRKHVQAEG